MILLSQMELLSEARYLKMVQVSIWGRKPVQLTLTLFNTQRECGTGGTWTLSVFFTVPENVIIDSIALNLFTFNGSNQAPRDPLYGAYDFKLKWGEDVLTSCSDSFLTYGGSGGTCNNPASVDELGQQNGSSGKRVESTPLDKTVTLTTGSTYTMELFLDKGAETNGCYVGLGAIELNVVPEPATASMGLVGLAALLFRCRRA